MSNQCKQHSINISFLGDISFNDEYKTLYNKNTNPFKNILATLKESDYRVGNLECLVEGTKENSLKTPRLKTNIDTLNYLTSLNIDLVTLANNHVFDTLDEGFNNTINSLKKQQIDFFGASTKKHSVNNEFILNKKNIKIRFLNYVHPDTNPHQPKNTKINVSYYNKEEIIKEIQKNTECNFTVLLLHWGGDFEGMRYPDFYQKKDAYSFIDAGADLIIGHHSHTFQPYETYKGKHIYYSLGNFCFADIHSDNKIKKIDRISHKRSNIVTIKFTKHSYTSKLSPIINNNLHIQFDQKQRHTSFYNFLFSVFLSKKLIWKTYHLYTKNIHPIIFQLTRIDAERSLFQRITSMNLKKLKKLLKNG